MFGNFKEKAKKIGQNILVYGTSGTIALSPAITAAESGRQSETPRATAAETALTERQKSHEKFIKCLDDQSFLVCKTEVTNGQFRQLS